MTDYTDFQRTGGLLERWKIQFVYKSRSGLALLIYLLALLYTFNSHTKASDNLQNSGAERSSQASAKAKFSFGYDNNVSERRDNAIESRFYQLYINSGMNISPTNQTLLSLRLQDGLKYLDAPSLSNESVLINSLNLYLSHRISDLLIPEIQNEIKSRTSIHSRGDIIPSEEAYLRGSVGVALRSGLYNDITGKIFYHYRFINFEDYDPFDRRGPLMGLKADVQLLSNSTVGVQYSYERMHYGKWDIETKRLDRLNDISLFLHFYKYLLFNISFSHQSNNSDIKGYSYKADKFALLMAKSLPWDIMFQLNALIRSKKYHKEQADATQIEPEDDERGMLNVKISRDISEDISLEAQYDFYSSSKENQLYTKSIFSISLSLTYH